MINYDVIPNECENFQRKLADLGLSLRLMSSYSTNQDFIVDLSGQFSPRGWGGTPFGPFPVFFPFAFGVPMVEAVLSDYTVNSLLYWMHKLVNH